jgi:hypothetical protein
LNITWEDEDTTARLNDIIETAIPILKHKLGITDDEFDFAVAGMENNLFRAYCLYEWNHVVNEFDDNYHNDIAMVRDKYAVERYLAEVAEHETEV